MSESMKAGQSGESSLAAPERQAGQATLEAIIDVSIAATDAVGRVAAAPRKTRWLPIASFLVLLYAASSLVAIFTLKSAPWVCAFLTPLLPVLIATGVFWRRQVWKFRSREWRFKEKARQDALNSLAHEAANGTNAIRANLDGALDARNSTAAGEHRKQVERALTRIDAALEKSEGTNDAPPEPSMERRA